MELVTHLWQVWPGRHWPLSGEEEGLFVQRLSELAADGGATARATRRRNASEAAWTRDDITAVVNALRCGLTPTELLAFGPGLRPRRLLAGYRALEALRTEAVSAWRQVMTEPSRAVLGELGPLAARLVSAPVYKITESFGAARGQTLEEIIGQVDKTMRRVRAQATAAETRMAAAGRAGQLADARRLGTLLYHPYAPGLWGHPYYLSPRVGALSSARVANLLESDQ